MMTNSSITVEDWLAYYDEETRQICVKPFSGPLALNYMYVGISTNRADAIAIVKTNLRYEANALRKLAANLEAAADEGSGE